MMEQLPPQEVYLRPGEIYFGKGANITVRTLLGSCVAITLWHPKKHFGGMCHITMPARGFNGQIKQLDACYADDAMWFFMNKINLFKLSPKEFVVRLYGGGRMFGNCGDNSKDIGGRNISSMQDQLDKHGFVVSESKSGGTVYRKIWLSLANGNVRLIETRHKKQEHVVEFL